MRGEHVEVDVQDEEFFGDRVLYVDVCMEGYKAVLVSEIPSDTEIGIFNMVL